MKSSSGVERKKREDLSLQNVLHLIASRVWEPLEFRQESHVGRGSYPVASRRRERFGTGSCIVLELRVCQDFVLLLQCNLVAVVSISRVYAAGERWKLCNAAQQRCCCGCRFGTSRTDDTPGVDALQSAQTARLQTRAGTAQTSESFCGTR